MMKCTYQHQSIFPLRLCGLALLLVSVLLIIRPVPALADGGGPENAPTPTVTLLPTWTPKPNSDTTSKDSIQSTIPDGTVNPTDVVDASANPAVVPPPTTGGGGGSSYLWPLGLLLLAMLAFGAIAFLLLRKK